MMNDFGIGTSEINKHFALQILPKAALLLIDLSIDGYTAGVNGKRDK